MSSYTELIKNNSEGIFIISKNDCSLCEKLKGLFDTIEVEYKTYLYQQENEINDTLPFKEEMKKDDDVKEEMRGKRMEDDVKEEMKDDDVKEMMRGARYEEDDVKEMMRGQKFEEDDIKEQEDVDVEDDVDVDVKDEENVDVDVEKDIDVDDVSKESDIEVKSEIPGESSDVAAILGLLTKAQEKAESMGDEKLLDQIGNTITYYTRAHVVKATNEDLESGEYGAPIDAKLDVTKGDSDVAGVLGAEAALNLQEVERFKKLAGLIK